MNHKINDPSDPANPAARRRNSGVIGADPRVTLALVLRLEERRRHKARRRLQRHTLLHVTGLGRIGTICVSAKNRLTALCGCAN